MNNIEKELNKKIFGLLDLIKEKEVANDSANKSKDLKGSEIIFDLGEVTNLKSYNTDEIGRIVSYYSAGSKGESTIGLNEKNYLELMAVSNKLLEIENIQKFVTIEFIEEEIFNWLCDVFRNKKANEEPFSYLLRIIEEHVNQFIFYLPLIAIEIEEEFEIGNISIKHIDNKNKIKWLSDIERSGKNKKAKEKEFDSIYKSLENRIVATYESKGVYDKAEKKANLECILSINALKAFLVKESLNRHTQLLEPESKSLLKLRYKLFHETVNQEFDLSYVLKSNDQISPTELTKSKLDEINKVGFKRVSLFLKNKQNNEIDIFISRLLNEIGDYTSTKNLHERIVKIISFFEGIFIPIKKGKGRGLSIIKKALPIIVNKDDVELCESLFIKHYAIRDKYLHNRIEIRISYDEIYRFQFIPLVLIGKFISLRDSYNSRDSLINHFIET